MKDVLGDRMKANYEDRGRHYLTRRTPVIVRVDGRAFHTFTRGCQRPFDPDIINIMVASAIAVFNNAQGCKLAYVQSDEASFVLTDYDNLETQAWFDYNKSKIETVTASTMSAVFNLHWQCLPFGSLQAFLQKGNELATFDARSFNIPEAEVVNYFLWRSKDWHRNSVSMYTRAHFSHAALDNKCLPDMHEMLYGIGKNWATDLSPVERNGTFLVAGNGLSLERVTDVEPHYASIEVLWQRALGAIR